MNHHILQTVSHHLQTTFNPAEYQAIVRRNTGVSAFRRSQAGSDYWNRLPKYTVSRCPLCGAMYTVTLDTHSLAAGWNTNPDAWKNIPSEEKSHAQCNHFVAIQTFVNVNGIIPNELSYYHNELDVPFIMPSFVPNDSKSFAVMHSLPICRIEDRTFVPRYLAFMVTYYADRPDEIIRRRREENQSFGLGDAEYQAPSLFTSDEALAHPEAWNLPLWVANKKLQWLDSTVAQLPLRVGPPEAFPYAHIRGYRRPFTIRYGKLQLGI